MPASSSDPKITSPKKRRQLDLSSRCRNGSKIFAQLEKRGPAWATFETTIVFDHLSLPVIAHSGMLMAMSVVAPTADVSFQLREGLQCAIFHRAA